jgi:hypothetical protein
MISAITVHDNESAGLIIQAPSERPSHYIISSRIRTIDSDKMHQIGKLIIPSNSNIEGI